LIYHRYYLIPNSSKAKKNYDNIAHSVMKKKNLLYGILLVSALAFILYHYGFSPEKTRSKPANQQTPEKTGKDESNPKSPEESQGRRDQFDRNISRLIYTKHAKCRMDCRHIDESEVRDVLQKGEINYQKSDMRAHPDPKYALEGITGDGQRVRIIFAPSPRGMVVITVIDLNKEWICHCD
jgi:Domain of unknown function (DUF4258)